MGETKTGRLLALAIGREKELRDFFSDASARSVDTAVKEAFGRLAGEEAAQIEQLERLAAGPSVEGMFDAETIGAMLDDFSGGEPLPSMSTAMVPQEAMAIAAQKVAQAMELYIGLKSATKDGPAREMLDGFMTTEMRHCHTVENMYASSGFPGAF
jgi:rubrerythrin